MRSLLFGGVALVAVFLSHGASGQPTPPSPPAKPARPAAPALSREDFNRLAVQANLPLFWVEDKNGNQAIDPDELALTGKGKLLKRYAERGRFKPRFDHEYQRLIELRRLEAVHEELSAGRPILLQTDFSTASAQDKALLREILVAAAIIEDLYLAQTGGLRHQAAVARADPASQALFWRNHGPWCQSPTVGSDPFCNAAREFPPQRSGAYPEDMVQDEAMCRLLQQQPDAKQLLDPFTVVRKQGGKFVAVPYHQAFGPQMKAVAARLRAAAAVLKVEKNEQALQAYLLGAAKGFETNDWAAADEAWAAMNSANSKWYLRIAPDEVYFDPCQQKAGFHVSFARIDPGPLAWQQKLTPLRSTMEQELARLIGKPYAARTVNVHMPDFIAIVLNAGDSRHPVGGTIGQSLPNWGKVAEEGRGRTVVMTNLYSDPDSQRQSVLKAKALLSPASMAWHSSDPQAGLINIILHEATHNFGPYSDYKINGKVPKEVFGGGLASTLEELKAQTGGLWYLQLLRKRGLLDEKQLRQAYVEAITWAFGHISRGMYAPTGNVQPYSQLAAIQVASFTEDGALSYADGKFTINFDKLPAAIEHVIQRVGRIKAKGDRKAAEELINYYIKGKGHPLVHEARIREALLPFPKGTFRYAVVF